MEPLGTGDPPEVGGFRLLGRLGAGGMGTVYLGRSPAGLAAVKVMREEIEGGTTGRARFAREAQTAGRLRNQRIARILAADPEADPPWLAIEYLPAPTLQEAVTQYGPLPEAGVRALATGLVEALTDLHAAGLVHRDVKPSNILLCHDGPRLIDFGIAREARQAGQTALPGLTSPGQVIGTPGFLSPEQAVGRPVGPPTDIFCLASTLVFAATGGGPFDHDRETPGELRALISTPDLGRVPEALRDSLAQCLSKAPAERPTAEQLTEQLAGLAPLLMDTPPGGAADWLPQEVMYDITRRAVEALGLLRMSETPPVPVHTPVPTPTERIVQTPPPLPPPEPELEPGPSPIAMPMPGPVTPVTPAAGAAVAHQVTEAGIPRPEQGQHRRSRRSVLLGISVVAAAGLGGAGIAEILLNPAGNAAAGGDGDTYLPTPSPQSGPASAPAAGYGTTQVSAKQALFSFPTKGVIHSSPTLYEDSLFIGSDDHHLYALDTLTGEQRWAFAAKDIVWSPPAVANELVYAGSYDNHMYALDADTGKPGWVRDMGNKVCSRPLVLDGAVYFGCHDTKVYSLDALTGAVRWSYPTGAEILSSAAAANGVLYIGSFDYYLYAIRISDHSLVWRFRTGASIWSIPVVSGGTVYIGSLDNDNSMYAINTATGKQIWRYVTGGRIVSTPAVQNGTVVFGCEDSKVYCLNAASGHLVWSLQTGATVDSSPTVVGGVVYIGSLDGNIYALDAGNGTVRWRARTGAGVYSSPAVRDGVVYAGGFDSSVHALAAATGLA